jgi:hypothetical protein
VPMPDDPLPSDPLPNEQGPAEQSLEQLLGQLADVRPTDQMMQRALDSARDAVSVDSLEHDYAINGAMLAQEIPRSHSMFRIVVAIGLTAAGIIGIAAYAINAVVQPNSPNPNEEVAVPQPSDPEPSDPQPNEIVGPKPDSDEPNPNPNAIEIESEWGSLVGTIKYLGEAPKARMINNVRLQQVCGNKNVLDERLVVHAENNGIKNVIVFLRLQKGATVPIHPSYDATKNSDVVIDNKGCRFEPHIALLRTTQTLVISNNDPFGHNYKIDTMANQPANVIVPPGKKISFKMGLNERLPTSAGCNIHPWMNSFVLIKDNPYMALTDENGRFEIDYLPVGEWTFQFWHESIGYISELELNGVVTKWARGRVDVEIHGSEENGQFQDMGSIEVPTSAFEE